MLNGTQLLARAQGFAPWLSGIYRDLHRMPEVAFHEVNTHRYLRARLDELGIPFLAPQENVTIGLIEGGGPGACVGLRCDTDALPVQEETGLPFASQNPGVMHACGHDGHMALGLGAARLLLEHKSEWAGRVKLIFQPAEEGENGADIVVNSGLVDDVDVFFAIHLWSPFESGTLHVSPIVVSAAVNMFLLRVVGRGGHGATPEKCADALVAGAAIVSALQTVVARGTSPMEPAVLTVGSFHAGTAGNIIAPEAVLKGTLRSVNEKTRQSLERQVERIARGVAEAHGCTVEITNRRLSDVVLNTPRTADLARECALTLVSEDRVLPQRTMMLGDDFANYARIAPICYAQVGIADEAKGTCAAHHNGHFRIDEDMLPLSAAWMASFAARAGETWLNT